MRKKGYSARTSLLVFSTIIILLILGSYSIHFEFYEKQKRANAASFLSKENEKMLGEISYLSSQVIEKDFSAKENLKTLIKQYENNLNLFHQGGVLKQGGQLTYLQEAQDEALVKINKIENNWGNIKIYLDSLLNHKIEVEQFEEETQVNKDEFDEFDLSNIAGLNNNLQNDFLSEDSSLFSEGGDIPIPVDNTFEYESADNQNLRVVKKINPIVANAYRQIKDNIGRLKRDNELLSRYYTSQRRKYESYVYWVDLVFSIALILVLIVGIRFFIKKYIRPLKKIAHITRNISQGDLSQKLNIEGSGAVEQLTENINQIIDNLNKTSQFAREIGDYNFDQQFQIISKEDILGNALLGMRDNLKKIHEEDEKRNWINEGYALIVDILRSESENIKDLSFKVVSSLVKYIGALSGGIFILDKEKEANYAELVAGFAYDRRKYQEKKIEIGQGLVGQTLLEGETLYLDTIPVDYMDIASGLGETSPKYLLIVPLIDNNQTHGAIEIASFKPIEAYQIDFIEKLSENIASTIANFKNTNHIKNLLDESQKATAQLQDQDEEMRQQMEELAATQEIMERNQIELEKYKENLEYEVKFRTEELVEKEAQLSEALTIANLAPWRIDKATGELNLNNNLKRLLGIHGKKVAVLPYDEFIEQHIDERNRKELKALIEKAFESKGSFERELELRLLTENEKKSAILSIKAAKENHQTVSVYGIIQDITRQKKIQEQLQKQQEEQQKLVAIVENTSDYVLMADQSQKIIYVNKASEVEFLASEVDWNTLHINDFFSEENKNVFTNDLLPLLSTSGYWQGEMNMLNLKTGQEVLMSGNIFVIKDIENQVVAYNCLLRDITEERKAQQAIELANTRMATVLESTEDEIVALDRKANILAYNTQWENFLLAATGLKAEIGKNLFKDYEFKDRRLERSFKKNWRQALEGEQYTTVDIYKDETETEWYFQRSFNPIKEQEGTISGAVCFTKNITEQYKAEAEIKKSQSRLQAISSATVEGIFFHDMGIVLDVNPAFEEITGYKAEEIIGKFGFDILDEESKAVSLINMQLGYTKPYEAKLNKKDGTVIPVEIQGRVQKYEGQMVRVMSVRDISLQKEALRQLESSQEMMNKIINALPQSIYWKNREQEFLGCNEPFSKTLQLENPEEIIGKTYLTFWDEAEAKESEEVDTKVMEEDNAILNDLVVRKDKNGQEHWLRISKVPFHDNEGKVSGLIGIQQDVTSEMTTESTIQNALAQVESSENIMNTVLNASPDWITVKDKNLKYILCNRTFAQAFRKSPEEIIGMDDKALGLNKEIMHGNAQKGIPGILKMDKQVLENQMLHESNHLMFIQNGSSILHEILKLPLKDRDNKVIGVITLSKDVTQERKAQENLRQQQIITEQLIENSRESMVALNTDRNIINYNDKMRKTILLTYGKKIEEGMDWIEIFKTDEDKAAFEKDWNKALKGEAFEAQNHYEQVGMLLKTKIVIQPILHDHKVISVAIFIRPNK